MFFIFIICLCLGSKLLYKLYKSAEQGTDCDEELDPAESFAHTNSVLKVCQECNFPGGIINSRLMQEFKTKIWRMNQALAKAKKMGGNGVKKGLCPVDYQQIFNQEFQDSL